LWNVAFEAFDGDSLHWPCHYIIWSPEAQGPWCSSGPPWMDWPPRTFSSCAVISLLTHQPINLTVLHKCLPVCLPSQMCNCAIYTATVVPWAGSRCAYFIKIDICINICICWLVVYLTILSVAHEVFILRYEQLCNFSTFTFSCQNQCK
jgi:hypothetical protein